MGFSLTAFLAFLGACAVAVREDHPLRLSDVRSVIFRQIFFTGAQAMRLVSLLAIVLGFLVVAQSGTQLTKFGGSDALGPLLVGAFVREVGPLVTVIVVVARSVSAIASELSSMKANGEIDGLRGSGVSPLSYLVFPRVVGGTLATTLLTMHFVWIALTVGFVMSQFFVNIPLTKFVEQVATALTPLDIVIFFGKTTVLSALAFLIACYCGLRTSGASYEIPQATTKAVVWSFMLSLIVQVAISGLYYAFLIQRSGLGGFL